MADMSDAGNALVTSIAGIIYPEGTGAPAVTGGRLLVYQGQPDPVVMAGDLASGVVHVSVFPAPGDKVTSISQDDDDWEEVSNDGTSGTAVWELRRQTRLFQIGIWAGLHTQRDTVAAVIDAGLAAVSRLTLADGSVAVMTYGGSRQDDDQQQAGVYRRELVYALNYATTVSQGLAAVATTVTDVTPGVDGVNLAMVSVVS